MAVTMINPKTEGGDITSNSKQQISSQDHSHHGQQTHTETTTNFIQMTPIKSEQLLDNENTSIPATPPSSQITNQKTTTSSPNHSKTKLRRPKNNHFHHSPPPKRKFIVKKEQIEGEDSCCSGGDHNQDEDDVDDAIISSSDKLTDAQTNHLESLIKIIRYGDYKDFIELLESGALKNLLNVFVQGQTALHYSLIYGRSLAWCKELIINGANPNLTNFAGWHPIHLAAFNGSSETMRYLIDCNLKLEDYNDTLNYPQSPTVIR